MPASDIYASSNMTLIVKPSPTTDWFLPICIANVNEVGGQAACRYRSLMVIRGRAA
jgi:hypothetical protein